MEMEPFPKGRRASLTDVVQRLEQVHACVESGRAETRQLEKKVDGVSNDVAHVRGLLEGVVKGLGLQHPSALTAKPPKFAIRWDFKTVMALVGSLGGVLILFRVLNAVLPGAWAALIGVPLQ